MPDFDHKFDAKDQKDLIERGCILESCVSDEKDSRKLEALVNIYLKRKLFGVFVRWILLYVQIHKKYPCHPQAQIYERMMRIAKLPSFQKNMGDQLTKAKTHQLYPEAVDFVPEQSRRSSLQIAVARYWWTVCALEEHVYQALRQAQSFLLKKNFFAAAGEFLNLRKAYQCYWSHAKTKLIFIETLKQEFSPLIATVLFSESIFEETETLLEIKSALSNERCRSQITGIPYNIAKILRCSREKLKEKFALGEHMGDPLSIDACHRSDVLLFLRARNPLIQKWPEVLALKMLMRAATLSEAHKGLASLMYADTLYRFARVSIYLGNSALAVLCHKKAWQHFIYAMKWIKGTEDTGVLANYYKNGIFSSGYVFKGCRNELQLRDFHYGHLRGQGVSPEEITQLEYEAKGWAL